MLTTENTREMIKTSQGRQELLRRVEVLRSHRYKDEEIALDLGLSIR